MSIEGVQNPTQAAYVLPQTISALSAVELAMAAHADVEPPAGPSLSKVVSKLQEAHRQAVHPAAPVLRPVDVQETHLLPSVHSTVPTVVASPGRVDVYV